MDPTLKRVKLSTLCVRLLMVVLGVLCLCWPWLLRWLIQCRAPDLASSYPLLLTVLYAATIPAGLILFSLNRLLQNIQNAQVFVEGNVHLLHRISICNLLLALVFGLGALSYFGLCLLSAGCLFTGLILQVVADVFARAVALQQENDYTI